VGPGDAQREVVRFAAGVREEDHLQRRREGLPETFRIVGELAIEVAGVRVEEGGLAGDGVRDRRMLLNANRTDKEESVMENKLHREPATFETVWASLQELSESQKETDRQMKETDRQMKETDRRLKKLDQLFTSQWGALIESLVEGDLVNLLQSRNIPVQRIHPRPYGRRNGEHFEFDILAVNGEQVVVVEVKTTLRPEDVNHFLRKLARFTVYEPEYSGKTVYGAVAYLKASEAATVHAERQGLFVIRATGDSASIVNDEQFQPRAFG